MEMAQLYQSLTFLAYATGVIVILVGIMLVKLLFDVSKLTKNINETTTIVKTELEPTLKNVNKSVEIVSGIVIKADEGIGKVKSFIENSPLKILTKMSSFGGSIVKGFFSGLCAAFKSGKKK
jgi:predicted PurR-regulated permease PerM